MGWEQILGAIIGLMGSSFASGGSGTPQITADQAEMQSLMKQMLSGQMSDYNFNAPLRQHITQTADWLLPKSSRLTGENGAGYAGQGGTSTTHGTPPPVHFSDPTQPQPPPGNGDGTDPGPIDPSNPSTPVISPTDPKKPIEPKGMAPPNGISPQAMNYLASYLARNGVTG